MNKIFRTFLKMAKPIAILPLCFSIKKKTFKVRLEEINPPIENKIVFEREEDVLVVLEMDSLLEKY